MNNCETNKKQLNDDSLIRLMWRTQELAQSVLLTSDMMFRQRKHEHIISRFEQIAQVARSLADMYREEMER